MLRFVGVAAGAAAAGTGVVVVVDDDARKRLNAAARIMRLVSTVGVMTTSYSIQMSKDRLLKATKMGSEKEYDDAKSLLKTLQEDQERDTIVQLTTKDVSLRDAMTAKIGRTREEIDVVSEKIASLSSMSGYEGVHRINAVRLRDMCAVNKGVYIKLGQHLAMLDYVLPEEYSETLSSLLADTPTTPWSRVEKVLSQDLGKDWREYFETIEEKPIASASLAQVHVGHIKETGKKVAIKVQHEGLLEESVMDMKAITIIVDQLSNMFEGFTYRWLTKEMNDNLPVELNFEHEKDNLLKAKSQLKDIIATGDLVIPQVHAQCSTRRVLTMDFEEGVYVTETDTIRKRWNLRTADISSLVSKVFCEQMYRHGFVHCDPHEGNILVRPHPSKKGKPTIVLLDHGLYRDLGPEFRMSYCRLWRGLVMGDEGAIRDTCKEMNVGPAYTLLAAMLTMRPWDDIVNADREKLKGKNTKGESEMLKAYAQKYFKDIVALLGRVDSKMLLLLKTNDCLRHLDRRLGAPINTTKIAAGVIADVLHEEERKESTLIASSHYWLMQSRIAVLAVIQKWLAATT